MNESAGADELGAWLRLTATPGVGPATCRALLSAFGLPEAVLGASREQLLRVVPQAIADALRAPIAPTLEELIARTTTWTRESGNHVVTLADARYPKALFEITDPPPLLYAKGRIELLASPALAIVGSRNASAQGMIDARRFAAALAGAGHTIVSGLALGIDAAAHEGALEAGTNGASTIAIIATGPDIVYPAAHRALAQRIAEAGLIVGEFPLGTTATAHHFPRRNRIIAGLARGVLVVEAAAQSGSLITARLAAECGREVFAIPGSIHSPLAKGCHRLIRQGAKLVESVADILEELGERPTREATAETKVGSAKATGDEAIVLSCIGFDPLAIDVVAARSALTPTRLAAVLLDLELSGRLERLPGGRVQRIVTA